MYQLVKNENTGQINSIRIMDGQTVTSIPFDPDNVDYQAYLAWLNEGNVPEPAEES